MLLAPARNNLVIRSEQKIVFSKPRGGIMAKRLTGRSIGAQVDGAPRLGTVLRFTPRAIRSGVKQLEGSGFRVASSKDFRAAAAVPTALAIS